MSIQVDVKPANAHSLDSEPWWHDTLKTLRPTSKVELDSIDATRLRGVPLVVSPAQTKMSSIQAFKSNRDLFAAVCRALAQLDQGLLIHAPSASGHYQMQWLFHCTAPSVPGGSDGGATAVLQQLVPAEFAMTVTPSAEDVADNAEAECDYEPHVMAALGSIKLAPPGESMSFRSLFFETPEVSPRNTATTNAAAAAAAAAAAGSTSPSRSSHSTKPNSSNARRARHHSEANGRPPAKRNMTTKHDQDIGGRRNVTHQTIKKPRHRCVCACGWANDGCLRSCWYLPLCLCLRSKSISRI